MSLMNGTAVKAQRRTLASQLDRLDGILDVLSDGLNEAVVTTVEQAVGTAVSSTVQAVLTELLTNPIVLARLREVLAPAAAPVAQAATPIPPPVNRVPSSNRVREHFQMAKQKIASLVSHTRTKMGVLAQKMGGWCRGLANKLGACTRLAKPYNTALLLSAGVGVACAAQAFSQARGLLLGRHGWRASLQRSASRRLCSFDG